MYVELFFSYRENNVPDNYIKDIERQLKMAGHISSDGPVWNSTTRCFYVLNIKYTLIYLHFKSLIYLR